MANLIRLKQIESSSALISAAGAGSDFSQSVIDVITGEVQAVLPDGIISSSAQVTLLDASGYNAFVATLDINGIATDIELNTTSSQIIDQGEW